ncbi:MAG: hypothetical protein EOM25_13805, partial [Deltaproteobacteria bacterium]|nr:hypothetical protein [Deltaproteobacteria bacterium]
VDDIRDKVTFHTLRHTCASWLVMAGESLFKVGKLLGHSQIKTTERYSHLAPDGLKDTMATLEAISRPKVVDIATART